MHCIDHIVTNPILLVLNVKIHSVSVIRDPFLWDIVYLCEIVRDKNYETSRSRILLRNCLTKCEIQYDNNLKTLLK